MRQSLAFILLLLAPVYGTNRALADRYALLVGIHDYLPPGRGGPDIPGVENDLELVRQTLCRNYGFSADPWHMIILAGDDATRAAMLAAFDEMASRVKRGDHFVFFYSGHGAYIRDRNGDERDGFDEAIVSTDRQPILDDELGQLLGRIGGRKAIILDSCFSGTGTRDITMRTVGKSILLAGAAAPKRPEAGSGLREVVRGGMDHVLIAACQDNQVSRVMTGRLHDGTRTWRISALTYYLCEGLRGPADADRNGMITYREAVEYTREKVSTYYPAARHWPGALVKTETVPGQTVQLEGGGSDQPAFGVKRFTTLAPQVRRSQGAIIVDVGAAHGFKHKSTFSIRDRSTVQITRLGVFTSRVRVIAGLPQVPEEAPAEPDAGPAPASANPLVVRVSIAEGSSVSIESARAVARALQQEPFLRVPDRDDELADVVVRLHRGAEEVAYTLAYPGGRVETGRGVAGGNFGALLPELRATLASAYAVRRVAELVNPHANFSVRIETDRGGSNPVYGVGERMQLRVTATESCYVTLIDIGTSGHLSILYPPAGQPPPQLAPGRPLILPKAGAYVRVDGPPGLDRIKVVATKQPLALNELVRTKGVAIPRGTDGLIDSFRSLAQPASGKGVGDLAIPYDQWSETSIGIEIR
ncbi:MAG: caspase family protein [Phycisphaerae bacterium]|nr:caspase family protein [Phycisphaerae bacterium]